MNIDPNISKQHQTGSGSRHYYLAIFEGKNARLTGRFTIISQTGFAEYEIGDAKVKRWRDSDGNWQSHYFAPPGNWIWTETVEWTV